MFPLHTKVNQSAAKISVWKASTCCLEFPPAAQGRAQAVRMGAGKENHSLSVCLENLKLLVGISQNEMWFDKCMEFCFYRTVCTVISAESCEYTALRQNHFNRSIFQQKVPLKWYLKLCLFHSSSSCRSLHFGFLSHLIHLDFKAGTQPAPHLNHSYHSGIPPC